MTETVFFNELVSYHQASSSSLKHGVKRAVPESPETQAKRVPTELKYVSAAQALVNSRMNIMPIPDISDGELLEMAIEFEKKHPQ
jgi:hypothetical protein